MFIKDQKRFENFLVELKILTPPQLENIKAESAKTGKTIDEEVLAKGLASEEDIIKIKALSSGIPYVNLSSKRIDVKVLRVLSKEYCERHSVVPFDIVTGQLKVAMLDPYDVQTIDFIEKKTSLMVISHIGSKKSIQFVISQYQNYQSELVEVLKGIDDGSKEAEDIKQEEKSDQQDVEKIVQDAPITRAVNTILEFAVKSRASDIHIEPRDKVIKVRYRVDGILLNVMTLSKHIHPALISRIKILSNLKIDEHRVPQDGRFQIDLENCEIDLRVSISPIVFGEKVVIRLLDKSGKLITLEKLGLAGIAFKLVDEGSRKPWGMILSTGPTGSGKSTTLYAVLSKINSAAVNIVTLEDPVEYNIDGINQIQVNPKVGLTFASGLRSVLRQDPDVIMVGEIRDKETADLAVQSALTGHVVLSTLHTNTASGVLPRLLDMEIEPFLIASTVNTVVGQRLVRVICSKCKEEYKATQTEIDAVKSTVGSLLPKKGDSHADKAFEDLGYKGLPFVDVTPYTLYRGKGCEECRNTGYTGRIGIFEVFHVSEKMGKLLLTNATSDDIEDAAVSEGMITMKQDGYLKALAGITTLQEVARVAR